MAGFFPSCSFMSISGTLQYCLFSCLWDNTLNAGLLSQCPFLHMLTRAGLCLFDVLFSFSSIQHTFCMPAPSKGEGPRFSKVGAYSRFHRRVAGLRNEEILWDPWKGLMSLSLNDVWDLVGDRGSKSQLTKCGHFHLVSGRWCPTIRRIFPVWKWWWLFWRL